MKTKFKSVAVMTLTFTLLANSTAFAAPDDPVTVYANTVSSYEQMFMEMFNADDYAAMYPEIAKVIGENINNLSGHYLSYGIYEGKRASALISQDTAAILADKVLNLVGQNAQGNNVAVLLSQITDNSVSDVINYVNTIMQSLPDIQTMAQIAQTSAPQLTIPDGDILQSLAGQIPDTDALLSLADQFPDGDELLSLANQIPALSTQLTASDGNMTHSGNEATQPDENSADSQLTTQDENSAVAGKETNAPDTQLTIKDDEQPSDDMTQPVETLTPGKQTKKDGQAMKSGGQTTNNSQTITPDSQTMIPSGQTITEGNASSTAHEILAGALAQNNAFANESALQAASYSYTPPAIKVSDEMAALIGPELANALANPLTAPFFQ